MRPKQQLQGIEQWKRDDVERLASTGLQAWTVRAPCSFEEGALAALENAAKLASLSFVGCELSRGNLLSLARLPVLKSLELKACRFEARDFAAFCDGLAAGGSPKLTSLGLSGTSICDEDLRGIGQITRLVSLHLNETRISDVGLEHLRSLKKLRYLWLDGTRVFDAGVLRLAVLPRLSGGPTHGTNCSSDIRDQLFRAQLVLQKSKKPLNAAQVDAANGRLRAFLREFEAWETDVATRANDIEARFRPLRSESHILAQGEFEEHERFMADIRVRKTEIARRFCSARLLWRGAGSVGSYSLLIPPPQSEDEWLLVDTLSPTKTLFVAPPPPAGFHGYARRYTLIWEASEWRLDEVQIWSGGWSRDSL